MSRLIDADILELDTEWNEYEDGFISYSKMQIDNAETVKAIPVDRVEKIKEEIIDKSFSVINPSNIHEYINVIDLGSLEEIIDKALKEQVNND